VAKAYLLYDDGCSVCTTTKDFVERFDWGQAIEPLGLTSPRARALAPDVGEEAYWSTFHMVRGGRVRSGADAFEDLLGILPPTRAVHRAMEKLPPIRSKARALYEFALRLRGDLQCVHSGRPRS
jgi:predicted DCC family thiol-disulfide oxidoreductase YuxK